MHRLLTFFAIIMGTYELPGTLLAASILDARGVQVSLQPAPLRIVSHALSSDEILTAILGERAAERLISLSPTAFDARFSNITDDVLSRFRERRLISSEEILRSKADLVILSAFNRPEMLRTLDKSGLRTFMIRAPNTLDDIYTSIRDLGKLVDAETGAVKLNNQTQARFAALKTNHPQVRANWRGRIPCLVVYNPDGTQIGANTIFDALVKAAGAENCAANAGLSGWPKISPEILLRWQPDAIVVRGEGDIATATQELQKAVGWQHLQATKAARIIMLRERELSAASQYVAAAAESLQSQLLKLKP